MRLNNYLTESIEKEEPSLVIEMIKKHCGPFLKELKQTKTKQFLYRGNNTFSLFSTITKNKTRQNRRPKDMDETTSNYLNELFKKKFGWYPRSAGVFAIADMGEAMEYGSPFLFFPIGKYKYIWSPRVTDLFLEVDNHELSLEDIENGFDDEYYEGLKSGSIEGQWEYDGIQLDAWFGDDRLEAKREVYNNAEILGIEQGEDIDFSLLNFVPSISRTEYAAEHVESIQLELKDIVSSYISKNLKQAINIKSEITFNCKEYYLVTRSIEDVLYNEFF